MLKRKRKPHSIRKLKNSFFGRRRRREIAKGLMQARSADTMTYKVRTGEISITEITDVPKPPKKNRFGRYEFKKTGKKDKMAWGSFGESLSKQERERTVTRINQFLGSGHSVVRILDLGAGSGKYWDNLIIDNPKLKGKVKVVCVNPTRKLFVENETKKLVIGSLLTMNESKLKRLLQGGKFHLVSCFSGGELAYSPEKELLRQRIKQVLAEPNLKKYFLT